MKYELKTRNMLLFSFLIALTIFFISFVYAESCWQYTSSNNASCNSTNNCIWKTDSWSSYCQELNCWSLDTQNSCTTTPVTGKNCTWKPGGTTYTCDQISCWSFSGTNNNSCILNTANKSCTWSDYCYNKGGSSASCYGYTTQATCTNTTGCAWGQCYEQGCWSYNSSSTCNAGRDYSGNNCTWNSASSPGWCQENNCWNSALYANETSCNAASGVKCEWKYNSCQQKYCGSFDFTNATACVNNSAGLACTWSGSYCQQDSCWSASTNATCSLKSGCQWNGWTSSGWCQEVQCWNFDTWNGGSESACSGNSTKYSLGCLWTASGGGNNGSCYKDNSGTTCTNITTEKSCYDTYYCWWQANNWQNSSKGGNCTAPTWGQGAYTNVSGSVLNDWNPGCYIFDLNSTKCNLVLGCNYTNSLCQSVTTGAFSAWGTNITSSGIKCSYINDSELCNNIPGLSTCCSWTNGSCSQNLYSTSCISQLDQTPNGEKSCEDADNKGDCDTIAGSPWYMPCKWSNSSQKCNFKVESVFGNTSQSLVKIENKRNCEAAGGKWISENYCEGSVAVPTGRCEYKFSDEDNCDKACFACENKDSNGNTINSSNAESACTGSTLGFCEFVRNTNAPNKIGYCSAKLAWKQGVAGDCDTNCGDCTYKGDPKNNDTTKKPSYYCSTSKANSDGGGCKWISDNTTTTGGYCIKKGDKTCLDACDRCKTQTDCTGLGRTGISNQTGSCKWQGTSNDGSCVSNIGADVEVCWDGVDNDADALVDCSDPSCYSDSYCGLVSGDCFGWTTNNTCIANSCEWVVDKWGSWCDFKGSQCWKNSGNESNCNGVNFVTREVVNFTNLSVRNAEANINITKLINLTKNGGGWVEGSFVITNASGTVITSTNYTVNYTIQRISFLNTTFMVSGGGANNITNISYLYYETLLKKNCEWSNGTGSGWCEKDWSVAEQCTSLNRTLCGVNSNCVFTNDTWCDGLGKGTTWCSGGGGWCDHIDFAPKNCWQKTSNSTCSTNSSGCLWKVDQWSSPHCEVNWSSNCWQYNTNTSCPTSSCAWRNETWGSYNSAWCDNLLSDCWGATSQSSCTTKGAKCTWTNYSSWASCQPSCFNSTLTSSASQCGTVSGCMWKAENGWCEEQQSASCFATNTSNIQANCSGTSGCTWKNPGWCSPKDGGFSAGATAGGGGVGTAIGGDCYKYDGNKTLCTNKTIINVSCGWTDNSNPSCQVEWNSDCWKYPTAQAGCNATNSCWFNNNSYGAWCMNILDQCWSNMSLSNGSAEAMTACGQNYLCSNTSFGGCEPKCFTLNSTSCTNETYTGKCKLVTGWCNPSSINEMFNQMESGAPLPLGSDSCGGVGEPTQRSVDICGFGLKDMGDAYGFGANVNDFSNASICNKEKISSFVTGMMGGSFGGFGAEKVGSGNDTIAFVIYLDTDGLSSGGCELSHNSSASGYEFRFKYESKWNASTSKSVESFNGYECDNSKWVGTDIKISTWKQKMCSEIGGPIIAVQKSELSKYPTLYDSTKDMRVYAVTIGNTGNITSPSDSAGPGYTTPGTVDFDVKDAFSYGADTAKFESILKKGFTPYEDCFDNIDNDNDNTIDCNDWNCQYSSACDSKGVNAPGYNDTKSAKLLGAKVEEYPDSALVMYDTDKPTNGTLEFYANDSKCLTLNKSIFDIGVTSTNVRDYKLWHTAEIYSNNTGYSLTNDTTYYYKLRVCDSGGKCALSKCSSFVTSSTGKCGYCSFVARIKLPSGWNVSYDDNQDGVYEHVQGYVCGANSGMKMNYTNGRKVNIKLTQEDGVTYFEFLNSSLTKTGLNDKVRSINNSGDIIGNSTVVGLTSDTRDKIINNLHPEICRIKVPFTGTCNTLYHCGDTGQNCTDKTSTSTLLDATNCIWQISNCEFSTYREALSTTTTPPPSSSSSGGAGGGGGVVLPSTNKTITPSGSGEETAGGEKTGGTGEEKTGIGNIVGEFNKSAIVTIILAAIALIIFILIAMIILKKRKGRWKIPSWS